MRKNLLSFLLITFLFMGLSVKLKSQTAGTLTFTYTQTAPTTQATKNLLAVWIEDNNGNFIKTKMRYWGSQTTDHLPTWTAKSAQNLTDASTGATRTASTSPTAFGSKTITWNGTNASGAVVPDGTYKVFVESTYCNPEPAFGTHCYLVNYTFTKGAVADHQTPTGDANFSAITLNWVPAVAVENINANSEINIFPNPSNGIITVEYKDAAVIKVENISGEVIYNESIKKSGAGSKTIDLSQYSNGTYFVVVQKAGKELKYKILLNK
ncbi:MAG: DUF2271 domain-containing protein [Bacteroidetes bacterium]|nr:DUF2271 domain-containing protein [Bacteroidota bacterium]